jgi:ABC-type transport system involved in cytochrome c biogenesis permease subunit
MTNGSVAALAAGACFLLATLAYTRNWRGGSWLGSAGAAMLSGALAAQGLRSGHWPLTNQYEFALAFALGTALMVLALDPKGTSREPHFQVNEGPIREALAVRAATMAVATALVAYAHLGLPASGRGIQPLSPALDSVWLPLHVGTAALAYAALVTAGCAGLIYLIQASARIEAESWLQRAIALGYPLLTLSLLLGMIWAQVAWGRYWGWDVKEVWTLIIWLVYTLYWHLRNRLQWKGRRLAWLALMGLGVVLFAFLGTGWLARAVGLESLHP